MRGDELLTGVWDGPACTPLPPQETPSQSHQYRITNKSHLPCHRGQNIHLESAGIFSPQRILQAITYRAYLVLEEILQIKCSLTDHIPLNSISPTHTYQIGDFHIPRERKKRKQSKLDDEGSTDEEDSKTESQPLLCRPSNSAALDRGPLTS